MPPPLEMGSGLASTSVLWLDAPHGHASVLPEYYQRELGLAPFPSVDHARACAKNGLVLAHLYTEPKNLDLLRDFPRRSIRLFVSADETYRPDLTSAIATTPAIAEIVRNYPLYPSSRGWLRRSSVTAARESRMLGVRGIAGASRSWVAGVEVVRRMAQARRTLGGADVSCLGVPLGYTDWFVRGLELLAGEGRLPPVPTTGSLLPYLREIREIIEEQKKSAVGFVGQLGHFQRRAAIAAARRWGYSDLVVREAFGGGTLSKDNAAYSYVDSLFRNRFALCPPGNYSGESFRLTEASLLYCVPVAVATTISDPLRPARGSFDFEGIFEQTLSDALEVVKSKSADEAKALGEGASVSTASVIRRAALVVTAGCLGRTQ